MRALLLFLLVYPSFAYATIDPAKLAAARNHFWSHRNAEAKAAFAAFAIEEPDNGEVAHRLGVLALREGKLAEAEALIHRAAELDPQLDQHSEILRDRGDLYAQQAMRAGLFEKLRLAKQCKVAYQKAVALDPANLWAHWSLMEFYRHAPGIAGGSLEKARIHAEAIHHLDATRGRFAFALVLVSEKKISDAFALFDLGDVETSHDYAALVQFAQLALITGQNVDTALAAARRCLALTPVADQPDHGGIHRLITQLDDKRRAAAAKP